MSKFYKADMFGVELTYAPQDDYLSIWIGDYGCGFTSTELNQIVEWIGECRMKAGLS